MVSLAGATSSHAMPTLRGRAWLAAQTAEPAPPALTRCRRCRHRPVPPPASWLPLLGFWRLGRNVAHAVLDQQLGIRPPACAKPPVPPKILVDDGNPCAIGDHVCDNLAPSANGLVRECLARVAIPEDDLAKLARSCPIPVSAVIETAAQLFRADEADRRDLTHAESARFGDSRTSGPLSGW